MSVISLNGSRLTVAGISLKDVLDAAADDYKTAFETEPVPFELRRRGQIVYLAPSDAFYKKASEDSTWEASTKAMAISGTFAHVVKSLRACVEAAGGDPAMEVSARTFYRDEKGVHPTWEVRFPEAQAQVGQTRDISSEITAVASRLMELGHDIEVPASMQNNNALTLAYLQNQLKQANATPEGENPF